MSSPTAFISTRMFGEFEASVIDAGTLHWLPQHESFLTQDWVTPDTVMAQDGRSVAGLNSLVVRTPDAVTLVDPTSWTPDDVLSPTSTLVPGPPIDDTLAVLGIEPCDVTQVIITHGHHDHFNAVLEGRGAGARLRFPQAEHFFPEGDWKACVEDDPAGEAARLLVALSQAGTLTLVSGDAEVLPGVWMFHTAGESDGHCVYRFDTPDGRLYYLGDLVHLPAEVRHPDWVPFENRDIGALERARHRIFDEASEGGAVVFTHARFPAWGVVERDDPSWTWTYT